MIQGNIEIINLVPKFLDFYKKAKGRDCETRFELWKKHYGLAAVPPGEEGALLARQQLEAAWENYENVIPFLEQWSPDIQAMNCTPFVRQVWYNTCAKKWGAVHYAESGLFCFMKMPAGFSLERISFCTFLLKLFSTVS